MAADRKDDMNPAVTSEMSKKRAVGSESPLENESAKKRMVTIATVKKWIVENDKDIATSTWLVYDTSDREHVSALKCSMCVLFKDKLQGLRNYNPAFVTGSTNLRASSFKDHAVTEMHKRAMILQKKSKSTCVTDYSPIALALSTIDPITEARVCRKFEIAYVLCKEGLAFKKMVPFCELEEKHGVDLGIGYKNKDACADFVKYIAQVKMKQLSAVLAKAKFFSIQADGTTDAANKEKLFMVMYFDPHSEDGSVHVQNSCEKSRS